MRDFEPKPEIFEPEPEDVFDECTEGGYNFQNERTLKYQVPVLDSIYTAQEHTP